MSPLLILVCPCFRKTVIVTCKIVDFFGVVQILFFSVHVIIFFFGNKISKWRSFEKNKAIFDLLKKGYFWLTFQIFLGTREKAQKFLQNISHLHTRFLLTLLAFLPYQFYKKLWIYHVWFLFGVTPGVDSLSRHFGAINKQ